MEQLSQWLQPSVIRRVRLRINLVLSVIFGCIIYLNHDWLLHFLSSI